MNHHRIPGVQTDVRAIAWMILLTVCMLFSNTRAQRRQVSIPPEKPWPAVMEITDTLQWAEKMIEARNEHRRLLAERDKVREEQKRRIDRRIGDLWADLAGAYPVEWDWLNQDLSGSIDRWALARDTVRVETDLLNRVAGQIGDSGKQLLQKLETLEQKPQDAASRDWLMLYLEACRQRRARRLKTMLEVFPALVFVKHYDLGGSHYAYTEGQSDAQNEAHFVKGSALCLLEMNGLWGTCRTLIEDSGGVIRDPDVSYDGKKILFAWKKSRFDDDYHLYEYDVNAHQLYQLTHGLGFSDYEGIYLPNGDLLFNSTRCVQTVDCWWTEVSNLYTCSGDGEFLRRLSFDQVHTNYPQMLADGRVIYTRWDYNDRGQIFPQPLFQMNPDGTAQTEFYGNNSWFPTTIMHARGINQSQKLITVLSGHHSPQKGKLALIDVSRGRQENEGVQLIAPVRKTEAVRIDAYGQEGDQFQYPYPINESQYIVGFRSEQGNLPYFGLFWMDIDGQRELLTYDPRISSSQPVPLKERPLPHERPNMVDYSKDYGTYYVHDVYEGPGLKGIKRGTAKSLRVVSIEFRAAGIGMNGSSGPGGGALSSTPPSIDNASWDVKKIWGSAIIYEDGSAMFTVPDRTPVYFQVLDEKNHVIQTMRSWSTLQPGEFFSCIGCHEHKNQAPAPAMKTTQAMRAGPQTLKPFYGPPRGFSFPQEIQPILDRSCISCHDQRPGRQHPGKAFSLLAEENIDEKAKRKWSDAYLALTKNGRPNKLVNWQEVQSVPTMLKPYYAGAAKSRLITMLEKGHNGVKMTPEEMDKIACWIDLLVPYCGNYREANAWNEEERRFYDYFEEKRNRMEAQEKENIRQYMKQKR
jgi:hypothetical protein